jgi:hypothetical protein
MFAIDSESALTHEYDMRPSGMKNPTMAALFLWVYFAGAAQVSAEPVITATSSLAPAILSGGETTTFTFTFTNADTPESAAMTDSELEIPCPPLLINGVIRSLAFVTVHAPGGSVAFEFDGDGEVNGVVVTYFALAKGASRTVTATFRVPAAGIENESLVHASATLTWPQAPGILTRSSTSTLQASPSLQAVLAPVPPSTSPGGLIEYRAEYQNKGPGIARRAWMIVPLHPGTDLVRVGAGSARPEVWFSTAAYPLDQVDSDTFVRVNFQRGTLDDNGTPADFSDDFWNFPAGTRMMALLLDDPAVNLFPADAGLQELTWRVRDDFSEIGSLIDQQLGFFSDESAFAFSKTRSTLIRLLPAGLTIQPSVFAIQLRFEGEAGASYSVERSGDFIGWPPIGLALEFSPGVFTFVDTAPLPTHGFYRIGATPAP